MEESEFQNKIFPDVNLRDVPNYTPMLGWDSVDKGLMFQSQTKDDSVLKNAKAVSKDDANASRKLARGGVEWLVLSQRFWIAMARENSLRAHANSSAIGIWKTPKEARTAKLTMMMIQPTIRTGVNRGARLCMEEILSAADYGFPRRRQLRIR